MDQVLKLCCNPTRGIATDRPNVRTFQSDEAPQSLSDDLVRFIGSSFRSVWALEILLFLKREQRSVSSAEMVSTLRASDLVVSKALDGLVSAGLASLDDKGALYMPVNDELAGFVDKLEKTYVSRPDAVRRAIVSASATGLTAFADAFRLRKD